MQILKLLINLCCLHAWIVSKDRKTLGKGWISQNSTVFAKLFGFNKASTPSLCWNTNECLWDAFRCLGKILPYYFIFNKMNYAWYGFRFRFRILRSGFETNQKQISWIKGAVIALWIFCSSSRDTPSVNCNRPTRWANYKQGCKNGVLIMQFSWGKEIFCL